MPLRVLTYNLHKGRSRGNRRDILHDAVRALAERQPDLLLCQEVFHGIEEDLHQSPFITRVLGAEHAHAFGPNAFYDRGCHGNATFARLPIATSGNHDISVNTYEKRGILHTRLSWPDSPTGAVDVMNMHFGLTGRQRTRQWHKLTEVLPSDPREPVVAAGDFNDWHGSLDRRARRAAAAGGPEALHSALWSLPRRRRRSFPSHRPVLGLDRIYFRGFRLEEVRVLTGHPWTELSDHLPVEAVLVPV